MINIPAIVARTHYPGYTFVLEPVDGGWLVYARFLAPCSVEGGAPRPWTTRKWYVSRYSCESEVVGTLFKLVMTSLEHEAREHFKYMGVTVYDPHLDVLELWKLTVANRRDVREAVPA